MSPTSPRTAPPDPQTLALLALAFLASDEDRLAGFTRQSGLDGQALRQAILDPHWLGAVLDYVLGSELLLRRFAVQIEVAPAVIAIQRHRYRLPR